VAMSIRLMPSLRTYRMRTHPAASASSSDAYCSLINSFARMLYLLDLLGCINTRMRLDEIDFAGLLLPSNVTLISKGTMAYQMRVDTGAGGDILEYLIDFHHMGTGDLYSVNFYMIKDGQLIQTLTPPTGVGMSVLLGVWYAIRTWIEGRGNRASIHGYAEEPKRARAYSRMFKDLDDGLGGNGPGKWRVAFDGSHEFILAKSASMKRLTNAVGADRPWRIIS